MQSLLGIDAEPDDVVPAQFPATPEGGCVGKETIQEEAELELGEARFEGDGQSFERLLFTILLRGVRVHVL